MTWEQRLEALSNLTPTHLEMRRPGNWYVEAHDRWMPDGKGLLVGAYGNGRTPEEAVLDDWKLIASGETIAINNGAKRVRWNGFMWEDAK